MKTTKPDGDLVERQVSAPTKEEELRSLSGVYFRYELNGKWTNVCFEELPRDEQIKIMREKGKDNPEYLMKLALIMADTIQGLGAMFDITTREPDEK